jgi:hypothetical protein
LSRGNGFSWEGGISVDAQAPDVLTLPALAGSTDLKQNLRTLNTQTQKSPI